MDYQIIATLGPSSNSEAMWKSMISAGVTAFRLNTSHLSLQQLHQWLDRITPFLNSSDPKIPLILDLQGSKWRLGDFTPFELEPGQRLEIVHASSTDQRNTLPVPHADFFQAAPLSSEELALNDAKIIIAVESIESGTMKARVVKGGEISPRKGITYSSSGYRSESLNERDREILARTKHHDFIRYAVSYVKDGAEMSGFRSMMGDSSYLIAKLERKPAIEDVERIAQAADELWVCRGDLGAEMGFKAMAETVSRFSDMVGGLSSPVIMAGQVLEHMTGCPTPTRSEVCYLHDTLTRGYRGFVLSDETAVGLYPEESCIAAAMFKTCA
jgi:pyruvate kinase